MTDTTDKPTLQDIADKDASLQQTPAHDASVGETSQSGANGESDSTRESVASSVDSTGAKGGGFVWLVLVVLIAGGSVAAGWPYIGPYVSPYAGPRVEQAVADLRALMGLEPRPTQARLPSEPIGEAAPETAAQTPPGGGALFDQMANAHTEPDAAAAPGTMPTTLAPSERVAEPAADSVIGSLAAPAAGENAAALNARLEAMDRQLAALRTMSGADGQAALAATRDLASALENLQTQMATLSQRLQTIEDKQSADPTASAQAMVLGVTQLRARLAGDAPFTEELNALEHIAAADGVVMTAAQNLRPYAETGIASKAALTARFGAVAKTIIAARSTTQSDGWLGAITDRLAGLVVVRRTDPTQITDEVERAVALSEAALEQGALVEAVNALSVLQGAPGDAAAAWLSDATARVNADAVSEALYGHALAALSAAGGA